ADARPGNREGGRSANPRDSRGRFGCYSILPNGKELPCYNQIWPEIRNSKENRDFMMRRGKIAIVSFSTLLSLLLLIGAVLGEDKPAKEPYQQLEVLSEVLSRIQTDYVESPNFTKVTDGALHGLLEALDPYSSYLTPEEFKAYQKKRDGDATVGA